MNCVSVEESDYGTPDYDPVGGASAPPLPAASRPSLENTKTPVSVLFICPAKLFSTSSPYY